MPSFSSCLPSLATLILLFGPGLGTAAAQQQRPAEALIIGGQTVPISQVPWQVALKSTRPTGTGSDHIGGGSIVAPGWILTSASALVNQTPATLRIRAGSADQTIGGQLAQVSQIIRYPAFNAATLDNDIALVQLASPLTFNADVQAIDYAADNTLPTAALQPGVPAQFTGWGATTAGSYAVTTQLNRVTMPLISNQDADQRNAVNPPFPGPSIPLLTANMFAVYEPGKGAGNFDGGGPVVVFQQGLPVLAGCSSWSREPQDQYPSICTRVRNYQQWIRSYLPAPLSVALDAYVIPQLDDAYAVNFTATAGGGPGPYAYAWQVDRNNGLGYQAVATTGSTYRVTIMTGQSICARVVVTTSTQTGQGIACATPEGGGATARAATERGAEESPARAYPNPTAGDLEVRVPARAAGTAPAGGRQGATPAGPTLIRLYNAQGVLAYSATAPAGQHRVDTRHLPAGVYQLRLTQGPHVTTEQIVVQH